MPLVGIMTNQVPPEKYSAESIVLTLDPRIDKEKMSKKHPFSIQSGSTYVVDLDLLNHPDDVNNCGVWTHSWSHYQKFEGSVNAMGSLEIGKGVFSSDDRWEQFLLRRLHSNVSKNPFIHNRYVRLQICSRIIKLLWLHLLTLGMHAQ